jgi:hypothetical protein
MPPVVSLSEGAATITLVAVIFERLLWKSRGKGIRRVNDVEDHAAFSQL